MILVRNVVHENLLRLLCISILKVANIVMTAILEGNSQINSFDSHTKFQLSNLICLDYNNSHYAQTCPDFGKITKKFIANKCNRNILYDRLPILKWLPKYQRNYIFRDLLAGITVGLTVIAQGIAYANIAGLDPEVRFIVHIDFFDKN